MAYDDDQFIQGLEWLWGEGFLSPGGPQVLEDILKDTDIVGKSVLDFGCGIGGIDRLLVTQYGADNVTGVDVVESLVKRAQKDAVRLALTDRLDFQLVNTTELPFANDSFDVVFTKDTLVHIVDKFDICCEFNRVLRNNGVLVGSDWLGSDGTSESELVTKWLDFSKLDFSFCSALELEYYLSDAGFNSIQLRDRNQWYRGAVREEIDSVSGDNGAKFAERFGSETAEFRLTSSTLKKKVVDAGYLRPTLFRALAS